MGASTPPGDLLPAQRRVLIVDDEVHIREVLGQYLALAGYAVLDASDGMEALRSFERIPPDLIILDLMLPGIDGVEVCRRVRATSATPILMLTARGDEADKIEGFRAGTDDYVTKPFSPREVVMRVGAIMRRIEATSVPAMLLDDTLHVGALVIRPQLRQVEREGLTLDLTAKEFDLLSFLAAHPRQVFSRQQLLNHVWDYDYFGDPSTVTVHMRRLREKVESDASRPRHIKTVWGVGYKFEP
ncbi:MAG: winged helix-turn-helix domain-containing protein [Ktedonobacterales bacterium]